MKMFAKLFKLDSKGKIREWTVTANDPIGTYTVVHGQQGGAMQETTVKVAQKNVGRSNQTSLEKQAELEAESKWNKQQDKGYRTTYGKNDTVLADAKVYLPMLAHSFKDHVEKVEFPCYYQPKLDGIRCVSFLKNGVVTMLSRQGKPFTAMPHIAKALQPVLAHFPDVVLDGEIYSDTVDFQKIVSVARKSKSIDADVSEIGYHVYDCFWPGNILSFHRRHILLEKTMELVERNGPLKLVHTRMLQTQDEVTEKLVEFEKLGYEGIMIRNVNGVYKNGRSHDLLKVKSFMDDDFEIVGAYEGKGKFEGMCTFKCVTADGKEFGVMPKGTEEERRAYWKKRDTYVGKLLTVRFFEYTNDKIPRFPVGIAVRDYE